MSGKDPLRIGGLVYATGTQVSDLDRVCAAAEAACVSDLLLRIPPGLPQDVQLGAVGVARASAALPLTVDAEVASVEEAMAFVDMGTDRVVLSSAALADPGLVERLAERIGRRGVVISIEASHERGRFELRGPGGVPTGLSVMGWAARAFALGAGGFLVRGSAAGDTRLLRELAKGFPVPVGSIALNTTPGWFASLAAAGCSEVYADLRSVEPSRLPAWERLIEDLVGSSRENLRGPTLGSSRGASVLESGSVPRIVVR